MTLKAAFAGIKESRENQTADTQVLRRSSTQGPKLEPRRGPLPLQGTAKSSHPDFTAVKIFVRRETHKAAGRKWQDATPGSFGVSAPRDFSDLVEQLLQKYLST
jgi:hypothetical protein